MLNPFPIQYLALLAYFILRLTVAGVLFYLAHYHYKNRHVHMNTDTLVPNFLQPLYKLTFPTLFPLAEAVIASFLLVGAWTQFAALAVMVMSLKVIIFYRWLPAKIFPPRIFYVLLLGVSITLFITGAGILAFDLPI